MLQAASYSASIGPLQAQLDAFLAKSPLKVSSQPGRETDALETVPHASTLPECALLVIDFRIDTGRDMHV